MLTQKSNIHRHKIPAAGELGFLVMGRGRFGDVRYFTGKRELFQVSHFSLCDNVWPYSHGIHTAFFKRLADGSIHRLSGFYFESIEN